MTGTVEEIRIGQIAVRFLLEGEASKGSVAMFECDVPAGARVPIGIVTDRDIVIETMALQLDATLFTAGDIMNSPLVTVRENTGFVDTLRLMRSHGVRRMPVVTEAGTLYGMVTADDIIRTLALELSLITEAMSGQMSHERRLRR